MCMDESLKSDPLCFLGSNYSPTVFGLKKSGPYPS